MRLEINGAVAELFVNDAKYSTFIVDPLLGSNKSGGVGLYVDIGTIGYFRNFKVTPRELKVERGPGQRVDKL